MLDEMGVDFAQTVTKSFDIEFRHFFNLSPFFRLFNCCTEVLSTEEDQVVEVVQSK